MGAFLYSSPTDFSVHTDTFAPKSRKPTCPGFDPVTLLVFTAEYVKGGKTWINITKTDLLL